MSIPVRADQDYGGVARARNLPDPAEPQEAATKAYVDAIVEGLAWKDNVRAAATGNVNLADPGTDTFDDVALVMGDRLLLPAQSDEAENGIYVFNGADQPLTRAADASTFAELENAIVSVDEGTANAQTTWRQSEIGGTIDTDDLIWAPFGTDVPDASTSVKGKVQLLTQEELDTGTDAAKVPTADILAAWSGRKRIHAADIGDGSNTSFTVTHNFDTRDLVVMVRENGGNYREVLVEKRINAVNSIDLVFTAAPTSNQYRVIILA